MAVTGNREPLISWRRSCFVLLAILFLVFLVNSLPRSSANRDISAPGLSNYHFGDASIDNEVVDGLTSEECSAEFPDLYADIERAVNYWKAKNHQISSADVSIASYKTCMRVLIHKNELRILETKHAVDPMGSSPDRALGLLHLFQRALDGAMSAREQLPTVEFAIDLEDDSKPSNVGGDTHSVLAAARTIGNHTHDRIWLLPNFDFWYYLPTGSFSDAKRDAMKHSGSFASKIPKIVWRGGPAFNPELRGGLIEATKGKDWANVEGTNSENRMRVDEFCDYAMTVYTEGVTYSGRLKFLMNCESLLFSHEAKYITHYSHLLVGSGPKQNYVPVKRDWSDLEEKVIYYLDHPGEADQIIANSLATFRSRYTTRAATSCYIRRLIQRYGEVSVTPEVNVPTNDSRGTELRGRSYEKFMDKPEDTNYDQLATTFRNV